jgi:hypothetical protein
MKLTDHTHTEVIRFTDASGAAGRPRRPLWPVIRAFQDRYDFLTVPTRISEVDFNKGVTFETGMFDGNDITKFQIYENGVLCQTKSTTELCDKFLDDILKWANHELDLPIKDNMTLPRVYVSQIEVKSEVNISKLLSILNPIGQMITTYLASYRQITRTFSGTAIKLHEEFSDMKPRPSEFLFERRAGHPYADELYFSAAPLTSADHMKVLDELERIAKLDP